MLIKKDNKNKSGSIFKCDRCGKELYMSEDVRYKISVYKSPRCVKTIKSWDLCKRCFAMLYRGIEKGQVKKQ